MVEGQRAQRSHRVRHVRRLYLTPGEAVKVEAPAVTWVGEDGASHSSAHPTTEAFYDISGRLVATEDA